MSFQNRPVNSSLRHPSMGGSQSTTGQSPMLMARINEKKAELENLKQLRDLSGGLAAQMQALEEKLSTLSNGTEGLTNGLGGYSTVLTAKSEKRSQQYCRIGTMFYAQSIWHRVRFTIAITCIQGC